MIGKSLCLISSSNFAVVMLSCLAAISPAAPQSQEANSTSLAAIGNYILEWTIDEAFPDDTSEALTKELKETSFHEVVCPMYGNYSSFSQTLNHISLNDARHSNISLITFILEKITEISCDHVKSECTIEQVECSTMSCSISSIANLCLHTASKMEITNNLINPRACYLPGAKEIIYNPIDNAVCVRTGHMVNLVQAWMRQSLSSEHLASGLFRTLAAVVLSEGRIMCEVSENSCPQLQQIECVGI